MVSSDYPGIIKASGGNSISVQALNPATSTITYRARDAYGGYSPTRTFTATGVTNVRRFVDENWGIGTDVGPPVAGVPYGGETLTHKLSGEAATSGAFEIAAATGQIKVKAFLDYETKSSYTGQVTWTVQGKKVTANVTIEVRDLEVRKLAAPTLTPPDLSAPAKPALEVTWTANADESLAITGHEVRYRKKGAESWTTYGDALSGTTRVANLPNLELGATYEAQVRALNSEEGSGPWSDSGEGTANNPPNRQE